MAVCSTIAFEYRRIHAGMAPCDGQWGTLRVPEVCKMQYDGAFTVRVGYG